MGVIIILVGLGLVDLKHGFGVVVESGKAVTLAAVDESWSRGELQRCRAALGINGAAMLAWSPVLFFRHKNIIGKVEGRQVADTKTKFDIMIWRITGLWVAFTGLSCLFVTDVPSGFWSSSWGFSPEALQVVWSPLACLVVATHAMETAVKYEALGSGVWKGAAGNIVLGALSLAALLLP